MSANPVELIGGLTTSSNVVKADMVAWAKARVPQVMADATEVRNTTLAGQLVIFVKSLDATFAVDTSDTTTPDDGERCIVSSDGKRFKQVDLSGIGKTYFFLIDGQSNAARNLTFNWTPNSRVTRWNNAPETDGSVGTAFVPLSATTINWGDKIASDIADVDPTCRIFIYNCAFSNKAIAQWLQPVASGVDVYANLKLNIGAALAAAGVPAVTDYFRWQGESDANPLNTGYVENLFTLLSRLWAEQIGGVNWLPRQTPVLISGLASSAVAGSIGYDEMNCLLQGFVVQDPDFRRFVYPASLPATSYWDVAGTAHLLAPGIFAAGAMTAHEFLSGSGGSNIPGLYVERQLGYMGFGPAAFAPHDPFTFNFNGQAVSPPNTGSLGRFIGANGADSPWRWDAYGGKVRISGFRKDGTYSASTALQAGEVIVDFEANGFDGTSEYIAGAFRFITTQIHTTGAHGTSAVIVGTPLGSTSEAVFAEFNSGSVTIFGATSGALTIGPPAIAGSSNITFPAGTTDFSSTGGSGKFVKQASVGGALTVVAPVLGDIGGLGTGVATALAVAIGTAGAPVVNGGALGTPASGVATNLTGTAAGLTAGAVAVGGITGLGTGVAAALAAHVFSVSCAVVNVAPANPIGTASVTPAKMMGLGVAGANACTITPVNSTRVKFAISGSVTNSTAGDAAAFQLCYGTGAAPANAAAAAGTVFGSAPVLAQGGGGGAPMFLPFIASGIATGLTIGVAYWFDIQLAAVSGGTASIQSLSATAEEV